MRGAANPDLKMSGLGQGGFYVGRGYVFHPFRV